MDHNVVYIDPQGGAGNLGMYDYELLSRIKNTNIIFIGGKSYDYLPLHNVKCKWWFNYIGIKNPFIKGLSYVFTMLRILFYIFWIRPSTIHIQWIRLPLFDIPYYTFIRKALKVMLVYTVHNILPHDRYKNDEKDYGKMYRLCDALMVHTTKTKEQLIQKFNLKPKKIHIAPHGPLKYVHEEVNLTKEISNLYSEYPIQNKTIFLMIGYQSEYKGTDLLIEAWQSSEILKNSRESVLVIAGKDADKYIDKGKTDSIICIPKKLSDIEFDVWIKLSDLLVFPYRRIEQSGVLLTVVSENKPYCTTDVGELAIPIRKNNVGWIIPEVSANSIRKTLEHIVCHKEEIEQKKSDSAAWKKINQMYDWEVSAETTAIVYESFTNA